MASLPHLSGATAEGLDAVPGESCCCVSGAEAIAYGSCSYVTAWEGTECTVQLSSVQNGHYRG